MATERNENPAKWQALVEEHERSGLSQKEFCKEKNVVLSQFVYYRLKFSRKKLAQDLKPTASFTPIKIQKENISAGEIKVIFPNGFQCIFPSSLEVMQVKRWLEVLLSC